MRAYNYEILIYWQNVDNFIMNSKYFAVIFAISLISIVKIKFLLFNL
jgi:hypothetical protein